MKIVEKALKKGRTTLSKYESKRILTVLGKWHDINEWFLWPTSSDQEYQQECLDFHLEHSEI